jgi:archaellum component FlaC
MQQVAPYLTPGFGAAIGLLFLTGMLRYLLPVVSMARHMSRGAQTLQKLNAPPKQHPFGSAPKRQLTELWKEFVRQRERALVTVNGEHISTVAPEDIFTDHQLLRGYNRNMAVTLAGVFTGLGILGTFAGLVVGMSMLDMSDPENVVTSVNSLLGGMSAAFYTSIFGIAASLAWVLSDRTSLRWMQKSAADFFRAVHVHYPVETADELLHRLLAVEQEESAAIQHSNEILLRHEALHAHAAETRRRQEEILLEQKAILQNLGSDLATTFQGALERSFTTTLTPSLEAMTSAVNDLSVKIGDRQVEALEQMVQSFQEQLAEQLGGQLAGLAEAVSGAAEWHERVHKNLETLIDRVEHVSAGQLELLEASSRAAEQFSSSIKDLGQANEQVVKATGSLEQAAGHTRSLAEALETRVREVQAQLDHYRTANSELREAIAEQLDAVVGQTTHLTEFWQQFRGDLQGVGGELRESVAEFRTVTEEKLGEIFARFDSEMAKVVEHLAGTLAEVREVTETLPSNVERFSRVLEHGLAGIRTDIPESIRKLDEALQERLGTLADVRDGIQRLDASIKSAVSETNPIAVAGNAVARAVTGGGSVEQAVETVRVTNTSLRELSGRVDANSQALTALLYALQRDGRGKESSPDGTAVQRIT